jgi:hypothetical protein
VAAALLSKIRTELTPQQAEIVATTKAAVSWLRADAGISFGLSQHSACGPVAHVAARECPPSTPLHPALDEVSLFLYRKNFVFCNPFILWQLSNCHFNRLALYRRNFPYIVRTLWLVNHQNDGGSHDDAHGGSKENLEKDCAPSQVPGAVEAKGGSVEQIDAVAQKLKLSRASVYRLLARALKI